MLSTYHGPELNDDLEMDGVWNKRAALNCHRASDCTHVDARVQNSCNESSAERTLFWRTRRPESPLATG